MRRSELRRRSWGAAIPQSAGETRAWLCRRQGRHRWLFTRRAAVPQVRGRPAQVTRDDLNPIDVRTDGLTQHRPPLPSFSWRDTERAPSFGRYSSRGGTTISDFKDRVQQAVGETYRIERELGGGGMSRVFVATEPRLDRQVVIKVLPPEMAAGVNVERFEREIQLAAKLQHPHIVPLLSAGSKDDLLYYVMPYIEGESLRAKLAREGELPVAETVRILKDVLDALSYAHEQGIVHRDIKPDNVMIARRHAVVTDFGVAKAVQSSTGESSLTSLGVALGTPAYMSPEQAAADPHVDHRADLYALGAMAYEMLTGRPPFTGHTPQAVLSAHVTQSPDPVTVHRETVPPALADLLMQCLAKKPADRPQSAEELIPRLDALLTPSGGMTPTGTQPVAAVQFQAQARRAHPLRVGALFGGAAVVVLGIVYGLMLALGLPDWVFFAAIALMAIGFPVMLLTGHQERKRAMARATGVHTMTPTGVKKLFTWRRALMGGGAAFLGLAVVVGGVMTMRSLGIGPFATLVSSGALKNKQTIILADFVNRSNDSTLGPTLTEAFRVDLAESPTVTLMDPQAIGTALRRMQRPVDTKISPDVAHDVAEREGISAIVTGQIDPVGSGYVLSASVTSTDGGKVLTAVRATASDAGHLIPALDELSQDLRAKIGESLVTIRQSKPLAQVTTSSLEALRAYTDALGRFDAGDFEAAIVLLKQAIGLDSGFAMAYRKLAAAYSNRGGTNALQVEAATRAFQLRDRLSRMERDQAAAYYYGFVEYDAAQATAAYRAILERDSTNLNALNNLALILAQQRDRAGAESLLVRAIASTGGNATVFGNLVAAQANQGHYGAADSTLTRWSEAQPENLGVQATKASVLGASADYRGAEQILQSVRSDPRAPAELRQSAWGGLAAIAATEGRFSDTRNDAREWIALANQLGSTGGALNVAAQVANLQALEGHPTVAAAELAAALRQYPLASIPAADRPYSTLVTVYAQLGRLDEARRLNAEYVKAIPEILRRSSAAGPRQLAEIARSAGRWDEAITDYQKVRDLTGCVRCVLAEIAETYDRAAQHDSALAYYERFVNSAGLGTHGPLLGPSLKRLGELYEANGDRKKALEYYARFLDLWGNADPDLQPVVKDVRARVARLTAEGR
jgi:tetratricopeptide (TPR) repeat protein